MLPRPLKFSKKNQYLHHEKNLRQAATQTLVLIFRWHYTQLGEKDPGQQ